MSFFMFNLFRSGWSEGGGGVGVGMGLDSARFDCELEKSV